MLSISLSFSHTLSSLFSGLTSSQTLGSDSHGQAGVVPTRMHELTAHAPELRSHARCWESGFKVHIPVSISP